MKMKVLKLATMIKDSATKTEGMLTNMIIDMDGSQQYIYQPKGLNPENGQPVESIIINSKRIVGGTEITMDIPTDIIGTQAEDLASGFKGTIIALIYHLDGCVHANIKPSGTLKSTGATIDAKEFDLRRLKGKAIKPMTEKKLEESKKRTPSPTGFSLKNIKQ